MRRGGARYWRLKYRFAGKERLLAFGTYPGSGLRYSFDIRQGKVVHEVGVDAADGEVLENSDDSNDKD